MDYKYVDNFIVERLLQKIRDIDRIFRSSTEKTSGQVTIHNAMQTTSFDINTGIGYDVAYGKELADVINNACDTCNSVSPLIGTLVLTKIAPKVTVKCNGAGDEYTTVNDAYVTAELAFIRPIPIHEFINEIKTQAMINRSVMMGVFNRSFTFMAPKTPDVNISIENLKKAIFALEHDEAFSNVSEIIMSNFRSDPNMVNSPLFGGNMWISGRAINCDTVAHILVQVTVEVDDTSSILFKWEKSE